MRSMTFLRATGNMTVDAVVDGTSKTFFTEEFPMRSLFAD